MDYQQLGQGFYWHDLTKGAKYRTLGRTIREADISLFTGLVGMSEPLFVDDVYRAKHAAIKERVAPGALVYAMAEGLCLSATANGTGLAFLHAEMDVKGPTLAGDTISVLIEITEVRPARKNGRGLVRSFNQVINQEGTVVMTYSPLRLMAGAED